MKKAIHRLLILTAFLYIVVAKTQCMGTNIEEIWKDVVGYEGLYEVSNLGRIKTNHGRKPFLDTDVFHPKGYRYVALTKNKIRRSHSVHKVVASSFLPNPNNYIEINHKDGVKNNNISSNLEWCDRSWNVVHSFVTGLNKPKKGSDHYLTKLTDSDVIEIRRLHKEKFGNYTEIGRIFGVTHSHVGFIVRRESWKHI